MDVFAQNKMLLRFVIVMVILNVTTLGFLFWKDQNHPPFPPPHHGPFRDVSGILKRELKLSDQQVNQVNEVRESYFEMELDVLDLLRSQRDSMNAKMFNQHSDETLLRRLAKRVSENEYRMELLRIEQAQALKKVCTPEQLAKFESLVIEIRDYLRPDNQPRHRK